MTTLRTTEDPWLVERLGRAVFRVQPSETACDAGVKAAIADIQGRIKGAALLWSRLPVDRIGLIRAMTGAGFYVVDVRLTFASSGRPETTRSTADSIEVRPYRTGDERVLDVAERAFRYSRFHQDPAISAAVANKVKRDWVQSYISGARGDALYVAIVAGQVAGFNAVLTAEANGRRSAVIDLIAVCPERQRRGIGRALMDSFAECYGARADVLEVSTQAANLAAINLYQRCGFRVAGTSVVLHRHLSGRRQRAVSSRA